MIEEAMVISGCAYFTKAAFERRVAAEPEIVFDLPREEIVNIRVEWDHSTALVTADRREDGTVTRGCLFYALSSERLDVYAAS